MGLATLLALSAYLIVDGRWYAIATDEPVVYDPANRDLVVHTASTRDCLSAGGLPPAGDHTLFYGPSLQHVQLQGAIEIRRGDYFAIEVASTAGDLACAGEVSGDPIFAGDFEPSGA